MTQEADDDHLDQSLRDTFSDFDLPPAGHIWAGIEGRLPSASGPPRPVPLRLLLLPLVGLLGVGVGWLLPRPAALNPVRPTAAAPANVRVAGQQNQVSSDRPMAYSSPRSSTAALAFRGTPGPGPGPLATPARRLVRGTDPSRFKDPAYSSRPRIKPFAPMAAPKTAAADLPPLTSVPFTEVLPAVRADINLPETLPGVSQMDFAAGQPMPDTGGVLPTATDYATMLLEPIPKEEVPHERRPEYRTPTHRLSERGRGLRRIQNTIIKQWQHLFGPRRARVAAQPDF